MIRGVLLAAGEARRFGADKLMQRLPDGRPLAVAAAEALLGGVDAAVAVVRPGRDDLIAALTVTGCAVVVCPRADEGMGASLSCGVEAAAEADGWLIALADMPGLRPETITALAARLRAGAALVAPVHGGERGHPVGFAAEFGAALTALRGDTGAREILRANRERLELVPVDDPGVLLDVDTPADLERLVGCRVTLR